MHRIGVVVTSDKAGGGEQYLRELYTGLRPLGIQGFLLGRVPSWSETDLGATDLKLGDKWSRSRLVSSALSAKRDFARALGVIRHEHQRAAFSAFHLQYKREQLLLTRALEKMAPVIWTEHGRLPRGTGTAILRTAYCHAAKRTAIIICVAPHVETAVRDACHKSIRTKVIPNFADTERFTPPTLEQRTLARQALGVFDDAHPVLASVSRLHRAKRIELAILSLDYAPPNALLVVAGTGPDEARLSNMARGRRVAFVGQIPDPRAVYHAADAFVMPYSGAGEGQSLSMLEAAACGLPVVATRGAGAEAMVAEGGGVLVHSTARAIGGGYLNVISAEHSSQARRWAERHNVHVFLAEHVGVLQGVIEARNT